MKPPQISRRMLLRGAAGAAAAAPAMQLSDALARHGVRGATFSPWKIIHPGAGNPLASASDIVAQSIEHRFTSFDSWWEKFGKENAENNIGRCDHLDADLIALRAPSLVYKLWRQKQRYIELYRHDRLKQFAREMFNAGFFSWNA